MISVEASSRTGSLCYIRDLRWFACLLALHTARPPPTPPRFCFHPLLLTPSGIQTLAHRSLTTIRTKTRHQYRQSTYQFIIKEDQSLHLRTQQPSIGCTTTTSITRRLSPPYRIHAALQSRGWREELWAIGV